MNRLYRALISLATVLPISIPYVFVFSNELKSWFGAEQVDWIESLIPFSLLLVTVVALLNVIAGRVIVWFLDFVAHAIASRPLNVSTVRLLGGDSLMGYLPYVLPLFISQDKMQGAIGWAVGGGILFLLSWVSQTISFSPLLQLCGLRFYEVGLADGTTATLLIKNKKLRPLHLVEGAFISEFCVYGVK